MANDDRVADVYYRRVEAPETQDACRDRVHWLCGQVRGRRVLDIGCSQGIVALLLGREGHEVVGIDIESEPLIAAGEALAKEPKQVQERIRFVLGDAYTAEFEPKSFDTVILGEVLEHLADPEGLLARVRTWLDDGGQVVASVPHGYHPYHDHKHSFFLGTLLEVLGKWFTVLEVDLVADRFLCAVARKPPGGRQPARPSAVQLRQWDRLCCKDLERGQRRSYTDHLAWQAERQMLKAQIAELRKSEERSAQAEREQWKEARTAQATRLSLEQQLTEAREQLRIAVQRERDLLRRVAELEAVESWRVEAERALRSSQTRLETALQSERRLRESLQQQVRNITEKLHKTQNLHKGEKGLRRQSEARAERLKSQLEFHKAELALREQGVRYRLGDALVRAARPSLDTLKLPFRLASLFLEGVSRSRIRRREAKQRRGGAAATTLPFAEQPGAGTGGTGPSSRPGPSDSAPVRPVGPPPFASLDGIAVLTEPFATAAPHLRRRNDLRVALVSDEFSWRAWQFEADTYTFTPKTWREALEERPPELLLIESTWSGLNDSWYFQLRDLGQRGEVIKHYAVPDVVAWCRQRGIPTVFYNKEDPPNFDVFVEAAKQFDYVFTSDANCIPDYRKHVKHERVFALPFAAQPRIHNPMMTGTRTGSVCFAGTWYAHRHFARHEDAERILRPALDFGLDIFDRMANSGNPNYRWPDAYLSAVRGALPYPQMLAAYRRYRVFLNVNSVKNSPTMFSRRVFELLACGTPVISSYSEGIEELLGPDIVLLSDDEEVTRKLLERVLSDDEYRERLALRGQRQVFCEHTYTQRLQTVLDRVGLRRPAVGRPVMTMIAAVEDNSQIAAAWENYRRQVYQNKRLVLCARRSAVVAGVDQITGGDDSVGVVTLEDALWGGLLREAVQSCRDGFVAAMNPAHYYGPYYLTDYGNATLYVTESALGKGVFYQAEDGAAPKLAKNGAEYRVSSQVNPWTLCLSRQRAEQAADRLAGAQTPHEWWNRLMRQLDRLYAADRFNYVQQLGGQSPPGQPIGGATRFAASEQRVMEAALA